MLGWITAVSQENIPFDGELLSCDGKFYYFRAEALTPGVQLQTLSPMQPVSFVPGAQEAFYPFAEQIRPQEVAPTPAFAAYWDKISSCLSQKRALHCFKVAKIARVFAAKTDIPIDKAELSGLLHDYAKEHTNEENARTIIENKLPISSFELGYHHILHAVAGACLAEKELGITDPEVLDGIRYHNGRPAMGTMDKITFMADHIDQLHKLGINGNPITDTQTIDEAIFRMILLINQFYVKRRQAPDVITECTMNYMLQSIGKGDDTLLLPDTRSCLSDDLFDTALNVSVRQSVHLSSVQNARQLGGYLTVSGKTTRENCMVRSARLCDLRREDAERLHALGIDTVIDLRSPQEIAEHPDQNTDLFRCFSCPLPTVELGDYQKQVAEKYSVTADTKEQTFYLSEYLSFVSMEDIYYKVLTEDDAVKSLQSVFKILCSPDTHGVLFHCTSGKDRTGIVAALILIVLGAGLPDIRADYYASGISNFAATEAFAQKLRKERYSAAAIDQIRYYNGIGKNIAEGAYSRLLEDYGSEEAYLTSVLQLTDAQRTLLCEKYLEEV